MNRSLTLTVGVLCVVALSGCSADKQTPAAASSVSATSSAAVTSATPASSGSTPTSSSPMVGGMTECTKEALATAATGAAQALGPDNLYTIDQLQCADGWAVTSGLLAGKQNPSMGAPTSFVFEQEGQFWVLQDKAKVCGTNPTTTTAPADAAIPAALFLPGCAAG